ncbi:phosphopantetheine adenylyltransferase, partial [Francisella tularensis subsp. holarctica]|nr:phosphopantetheine adenylyltransferase [Francisella tularensis subsp. holarctica]
DIRIREQMINEVFKDNHRVKVVSFQGIVVDTDVKHNACAIVRGLRAVSYFDYEFQMSSMNNKLNSDFQTIFITPSEKFSCI